LSQDFIYFQNFNTKKSPKLWNANQIKTGENVIALIHVHEKAFVVIVLLTTERWGNCLHVISPMMWKLVMTALLRTLSGLFRKGVRIG